MIRQGTKRTGVVSMGNCIVNAMYNRMVILEEHLHKVKDKDPANVKICVGSMGFKSDNGLIHWEYGDPSRTGNDGWDNLGGIDAHAWLTYTDTKGNEIIIDPWFRGYERICNLWNVRAKDRRNCRTYFQIESADTHEVIYMTMAIMAEMKKKVPRDLSKWLRERRLGEEE